MHSSGPGRGKSERIAAVSRTLTRLPWLLLVIVLVVGGVAATAVVVAGPEVLCPLSYRSADAPGGIRTRVLSIGSR